MNKFDHRLHGFLWAAFAVTVTTVAVAGRLESMPLHRAMFVPSADLLNLAVSAIGVGSWMAAVSQFARAKGQSATWGLAGVLTAVPAFSILPLLLTWLLSDENADAKEDVRPAPVAYVHVRFASDAFDGGSAPWDPDFRAAPDFRIKPATNYSKDAIEFFDEWA